VEVTVTNRADQILASDGTIPSAQIRSITRQDVLVDTGTTTLCLPSELIAQLGLTLLKEVDVATAQGISKTRIFQDARLSLCGSY
jgi:predicted aspartyl protease